MGNAAAVLTAEQELQICRELCDVRDGLGKDGGERGGDRALFAS